MRDIYGPLSNLRLSPRPPLRDRQDPDLRAYSIASDGVMRSRSAEFIGRLTVLQDVAAGYAVVIGDDTIAPRYEAGDCALINPRKPLIKRHYSMFANDTEEINGDHQTPCLAHICRV